MNFHPTDSQNDLLKNSLNEEETFLNPSEDSKDSEDDDSLTLGWNWGMWWTYDGISGEFIWKSNIRLY